MTGDGTARTPAGLWTAKSFHFLKYRKRERLMILADGRRAKVTIDDSGTVKQVETDNQLDAIVRPRTVRLKVRRIGG